MARGRAQRQDNKQSKSTKFKANALAASVDPSLPRDFSFPGVCGKTRASAGNPQSKLSDVPLGEEGCESSFHQIPPRAAIALFMAWPTSCQGSSTCKGRQARSPVNAQVSSTVIATTTQLFDA